VLGSIKGGNSLMTSFLSINKKNNPTKVTPYKVVVETEDGVRFYVPNNLVSINQEQFDIWYNSPYRGKLQKVVEFKN